MHKKERILNPLFKPLKHFNRSGLETNHVAVLAVGGPVVKERFKFFGVHVVHRDRVVHDYHIIPIGGMNPSEVATLNAFEVVTNLGRSESGTAGLDRSLSLGNVASLVKRRISVLGGPEAFDQFVSDFSEFAAVHEVLAVERIGRAFVARIVRKGKAHLVFSLGHLR